ncbi:DUF4336 domain-containing protein [Belnapia rosea]|uniref:DUF4336 domain-containing protein n=1 Tax=Belnapia rosea TaxID=938405 RepID=A0A1G6TC24_9PROT|nr:DUF4336 domain-containing protein [Belnapia rosea]SDD25845.1 protein of unknown function [Belnapia rosea]
MIPSRLHGLIDYGVAAMLGGLAASSGVPPRVRGLLGAAGAYHTAYSLMTDYEAGLRPRLTMRQHLGLDALGGAALVGAGLAMRDEPGEARALLIGLGLAELAVVALSDDRAASGPRLLATEAPAGYPPYDRPKPVTADVQVVDSLLPGPLGSQLPVRMTVLRLPDGGLLLHSPTRFSSQLAEALARLGPIRHLVAPNIAHWTFLRDWQRAFPEAVTWAAPGLRQRRQVRRSRLRLDHDLGAVAPTAWGGVITLATVPGGLGFHEVALFHEPSRTLVLTDLVLNLEAPRLPALMRPIVRLFGSLAPDGMPPPYLRAVIRWRLRAARQAAERLLALQPDRVIFAHGLWFERDGTAALRHSLRWLLD